MNDRQENKLSMANAVKLVLIKFTDVVKSVAAFTAAAVDFNNLISEINGHAKLQTLNFTGKRIDKDVSAEDAVDACLAVSGPTKAFATFTGNNELFAKVDYSRTALLRLRDTALTQVLYGIRDSIQAELANLGGYGVDAAAVNGFSEKIAFYDGLVGSPRMGISERRNATEALATDFEALDTVLVRLDGFADLKKALEPDFYRTYYAAREIVDNRGPGKVEEVVEASAG